MPFGIIAQCDDMADAGTNLSHNLYAVVHGLPVFVIIKSWKIIFQMQ